MKIQNWKVFTCRIMPEERGVLKIISINACLRHSQGVLTSRTPPLWRCYRCLMSPLFDGISIQIRVPSTTLAKIMEVFTFPASACNNKREKCGKHWKHLFCQNPHQWSGGWGQRCQCSLFVPVFLEFTISMCKSVLWFVNWSHMCYCVDTSELSIGAIGATCCRSPTPLR
jgi:hypothetical protein